MESYWQQPLFMALLLTPFFLAGIAMARTRGTVATSPRRADTQLFQQEHCACRHTGQSSLCHILWEWEPQAVDLGIQILSNGAFTQCPGSELYLFTEYIGRQEGGILSLVLIQITAMRVGAGLQSPPDLTWCQKPSDETVGFSPRQSLDSNLL